MQSTDPTPPPFPRPAEIGFQEKPTGAELISVEEAVLARMLAIQTELASLIERQEVLTRATQHIASEFATALRDVQELYGQNALSKPPTQFAPGSVPALDDELFRSRKTSVRVSRHPVIMSEPDIPNVEIPGDDNWDHWQSAWNTARARAESLVLIRLPTCPPTRAALQAIERANPHLHADPQLHDFLDRFSAYLDEYEKGLPHSKLHTHCQSLKTALSSAMNADPSIDAPAERARVALVTWEEKMNRQRRWFEPEFFDAELTEALTMAYDCLSAIQAAQPQLDSERLRNACNWLVYFLTLLGVHKDAALAVGVSHEQLPRHLRDKFPIQSLKPGRAADACKIAAIVRNRWFRVAEEREIQIVRPWYELA